MAAVNRLLLRRGAYQSKARAHVRLEILITGELPTQLIDPEDLAEAEAIWKAAHTMPAPAALASGTEAPALPADGVPVGPPPLASVDPDGLDDFDDMPERPARIHRVPMEQVRKTLLSLYQPPMRAPHTYRMMKRAFDVLAELSVATSFDLTEGLVAQLIKTRPPGLSCRTGRAVPAMYQNNFQILHPSRLAPRVALRLPPCRRWVRITPVEHRRFYTSDEVRRILTTMQEDVDSTDGWPQWKSRRLLAVTATCAFGGFRMSEAFRLHVQRH